MKKYKGLSRVFLLSYLTSVFAGMVLALLLVKYNIGLFVVATVVCVLDLAGIIVARCFFSKDYKAFLLTSSISFAVLNLLVIGGFVLEAIFTVNGEPAPYAWFVSSVGLAFIILIDIFYLLGLKKYNFDKRVENGEIIKEEDNI